jgi:fused signal recognition particle receptor
MGLFDGLKRFFGGTLSDEALDDLKTSLLLADVGLPTTTAILSHLKKNLKPGFQQEDVIQVLTQWYGGLIPHQQRSKGSPTVYLFVGVNGVGKTTAIAKLAHRFIQTNKSVNLIAGDTFRAGAVEQLQTWATRLGISCYSKVGSDPASVIYDGLKESTSSIILIDTAGRLQTKQPLMEELSKIKRVIQKFQADAPHETFLVLDATTGQNGLSQAKVFLEATQVTGIIVNKYDGLAKAGIVLAIAKEYQLPIYYIGTGESLEDLVEFDVHDFMKRLVSS